MNTPQKQDFYREYFSCYLWFVFCMIPFFRIVPIFNNGFNVLIGREEMAGDIL